LFEGLRTCPEDIHDGILSLCRFRGLADEMVSRGESLCLKADEAVAEIDVGGSGGGAEGGREAVEAAEAGFGDTGLADDGHVLGRDVIVDAESARDEAYGEGFAFAQFAYHRPAPGIPQDTTDSAEADGWWGGGLFHGVFWNQAEFFFGGKEIS